MGTRPSLPTWMADARGVVSGGQRVKAAGSFGN